MIEGIIFDVDGTLWDSTEEVAYSWNQAIKEQTDMDRTLTAEQLKREFGKPLEEIMDDLFPELAQKEQERLADHLYKYENKWVETAPCIVYDQMAETVRELSRKYKLFIVSNCQSGYIEELKNTGLGKYFCRLYLPGRHRKVKRREYPHHYGANGIKEAIYVGDTGRCQCVQRGGDSYDIRGIWLRPGGRRACCDPIFWELLELEFEKSGGE